PLIEDVAARQEPRPANEQVVARIRSVRRAVLVDLHRRLDDRLDVERDVLGREGNRDGPNGCGEEIQQRRRKQAQEGAHPTPGFWQQDWAEFKAISAVVCQPAAGACFTRRAALSAPNAPTGRYVRFA